MVFDSMNLKDGNLKKIKKSKKNIREFSKLI